MDALFRLLWIIQHGNHIFQCFIDGFKAKNKESSVFYNISVAILQFFQFFVIKINCPRFFKNTCIFEMMIIRFDEFLSNIYLFSLVCSYNLLMTVLRDVMRLAKSAECHEQIKMIGKSLLMEGIQSRASKPKSKNSSIQHNTSGFLWTCTQKNLVAFLDIPESAANINFITFFYHDFMFRFFQSQTEFFILHVLWS